jgi:indolepyruvate ferredoxin oxidoreductase alpha subunit
MLVLDNGTTAMTGHQSPPNSSVTPAGKACLPVEIAPILKATGACFVEAVSAFDTRATQKAIEAGLRSPGAAAVIARGPCALESGKARSKTQNARSVYEADPGKCTGCRLCIDRFGCAAFIWKADEKVCAVDPILCDGCGVCVQVCPQKAFQKVS